MFIGEYQHTIDEKGRMMIPTKFRADLQKGAVVTRGLDHCLVVYPMAAWNELATKLSSLPISQSKSRAFARLMLAGAMDVTPDKQGRIMIPEYLREYAGAAKQVVVAGLFDRLEIWDEKAWKKYKTATEKESNDIAEALGELGV
jgi:MraZ protein